MSSTLDPDLRRAVASHRELRARRGIPPAERDTVTVFVEFTGPIEDLVATGFRPHSLRTAPGYAIATGRLPVDVIEQFAAIDHVTRVESAQPVVPQVSTSLAAAGITPLHGGQPPLRGNGVVVGIIDGGFDVFHQTFRRADGSCRILALWDQTERRKNYRNPRVQYGVEYLGERLDEIFANPKLIPTELDSQALGGLGQGTRAAHGTAVAGIAAGSGLRDGDGGPPEYVGVAPEADLILVTVSGEEGIADTAGVADALQYIWNHPKVAGRPVVVNISLSTAMGGHDDTSLLERAIAADMARPGRAVVVSAGNTANHNQHAHGQVPANGAVDVTFVVGTKATGGLTGEPIRLNHRLQVWYKNQRALTARLISPGGVQTPLVPPDGSHTGPVGAADVSIETASAGTDRHVIDISWTKHEGQRWEAGNWTLNLASASGTGIVFDGWFRDFGSEFTTFATPEGTVGLPGTAEAAVTVGAYAHPLKKRTEGIADFSSYGPTRDGRPKPDVVAPGVGIISAKGSSNRFTWSTKYYCCNTCCVQDYVMEIDDDKDYESETFDDYNNSGTSFATPHVTGLVALMFEVKRDLTLQQIKAALRASAVAPAGMAPSQDEPPYREWGWGKINGAAAIAQVRQLPPAAPGLERALPAEFVPAEFVADVPEPAGPVATGEHGILSSVFGARGRRRLDDPAGAHWAALVSRHFSEVRGLITHQRRVALYWHRLGGPDLVRGLIREPDGEPVTATREVARFSGYLDRFLDELDRLGSARLRREVRRHRPLLRSVTPTTLVSALMTGAPTDTAE